MNDTSHINASILCLSGWAQPHDALKLIAPEDAWHLPYTHHTRETLFNALANIQPRHVIGWSLGGLLLMHAIHHQIIAPQTLTLLSSPVQFVKDADFPHGMAPDTFALFSDNFTQNPHKTAKRFAHLIAKGDTYHDAIIRQLHSLDTYSPWSYWLNQLGMYHRDMIDLSDFPPTLLIYGEADQIVLHEQGSWLAEALPQAQRHCLPECAHAPHLHNPSTVKQLIANHISL